MLYFAGLNDQYGALASPGDPLGHAAHGPAINLGTAQAVGQQGNQAWPVAPGLVAQGAGGMSVPYFDLYIGVAPPCCWQLAVGS